jgi:hypothetical protein
VTDVPGDLFGAGIPPTSPGVPEPGTCRLCGAAIVWIVTVGGKAMPCDAQVRVVITDAGLQVRGRESHFATCPRAAEVRRPRPDPARRVTRRG